MVTEPAESILIDTLTQLSSALAWILTLFTALNVKQLLPCDDSALISERVDILIPARNEAEVIEKCIRAALGQNSLSHFRVVVLNDASTDNTSEVLLAIDDSRLTIINSTEEPPAGWLGKPWACARLAQQSDAEYLVFIDADVALVSDAVSRAINTLITSGMHLVSPYPQQIAHGILGRLIQPLLQWSWLTTVPLGRARTTTRPSMAIANGQFLVCRRHDYFASGGHETSKGEVLEDIHLLRAFYRAGLPGTVVDGSAIATCTMYDSDQQLMDGYAKSLWKAFGGLMGTLLTCASLAFVYTLPIFALFTNSWLPAISALSAGIVGRSIVAQRTKQRMLPDVFLHSVSILAFVWLNSLSWWRHLRHANHWKGRTL